MERQPAADVCDAAVNALGLALNGNLAGALSAARQVIDATAASENELIETQWGLYMAVWDLADAVSSPDPSLTLTPMLNHVVGACEQISSTSSQWTPTPETGNNANGTTTRDAEACQIVAAVLEEVNSNGLSADASAAIDYLESIFVDLDPATVYIMSYVAEAYRAPDPMFTLPYVLEDAVEYCQTSALPG